MTVSSRSYCGSTAMVFLAVALVQGWRLIHGFPLVIGDFTVPVAVSAVLAAIALGLASWGYACWRGEPR